MSRSRILCIGATVLTQSERRLRRSALIWRALEMSFEAHLLVVQTECEDTTVLLERTCEAKVIQSKRMRSKEVPASFDCFSRGAMDQFREVLAEGDYDIIFIQAIESVLLAFECERSSPQTRVVVDSDRSLGVCERVVEANGHLGKNRLFSAENLRRKFFERRLYRRPYLFLFADPEDREFAWRTYWKGAAPSRFEILPDVVGGALPETRQTDQRELAWMASLASKVTSFKPGRMKLAIVANRLDPEAVGGETNVFRQACELAKNGCSVTVFTPKRTEGQGLEYVEGIRVHRLWNLFNPFRIYPSNLARAFCPMLALHLLRHRYDLVQSFPSPHYNAMTALAVQKLLGRKSVLVSQDFRDYAFLINESGKVTDMLDSYQPILRERLALEHHDHVFATTDKELSFFRRYSDNVSMAPVPIASKRYHRQVASPRSKYGICDETFVFVCRGQVSRLNGQDIALRGFDEALPQLGGAKLVMIGRTDADVTFFEQLSMYAKDNGLEESVLFTHGIGCEEVLGWLRHSDICVIPARFVSSSTVALESWASGTPVIQSDSVDPNYVVDSENGFLFKSLSVGDLAETMVQAYEGRRDFPKLVEAGNMFVQERGSYDYLSSLYVSKYHELIKGGHR